ncbi:MAG: tRNA adenosine(34) deaminase TadA [Oscillospiraceae bacterium]|nr:tRNA adenosine(34) deaminase TadA [Oscillospiraceae bacterium]
MTDEYFMTEALKLAAKAAELGEVPIGCVVVKEDTIVGRGYNCRETGKSALYHAEVMAIEEACKTLGGWRLWQCRLYVTLEPCPMCAGAIINARIPKVIYGAKDAKAGSLQSIVNLFELPYNHHPEVVSGVLEEECSGILKAFFRELRLRKQKKRKDSPTDSL